MRLIALHINGEFHTYTLPPPPPFPSLPPLDTHAVLVYLHILSAGFVLRKVQSVPISNLCQQLRSFDGWVRYFATTEHLPTGHTKSPLNIGKGEGTNNKYLTRTQQGHKIINTLQHDIQKQIKILHHTEHHTDITRRR